MNRNRVSQRPSAGRPAIGSSVSVQFRGNERVRREMLGLSDEEIAALYADSVLMLKSVAIRCYVRTVQACAW